MIKCSECKYWTRGDLYIPDVSYYPEYKDHYGRCSHEAFIYHRYWEAKRKNALVYRDQELYDAGFDTGEDFGCVHGEK